VAPAPAPAFEARGSAVCIAGWSEGLPRGDVHTAAALACQALRDSGADVSAEPVDQAPPGATSAYRVELRPLGTIVILQVSFESPIGTQVQRRSLELSSIEEVPVAAPRIADSIVRGTPLAQTAKLDTLVGQETREHAKKYGETFFAIGVLGFAMPDKTWAGYGAFGRVYYEAERYAVSLDLRLGTSANNDGDAGLFGLAVGARYFLNAEDISPFFGGGAGILWLSQKRVHTAGATSGGTYAPDFYDTQLNASGLAAYGEVGVEFLRMHRTRVDAALRADAPFFQLEAQGMHRYTLPIALQLSYSFD
jgi:hypothetical protein